MSRKHGDLTDTPTDTPEADLGLPGPQSEPDATPAQSYQEAVAEVAAATKTFIDAGLGAGDASRAALQLWGETYP